MALIGDGISTGNKARFIQEFRPLIVTLPTSRGRFASEQTEVAFVLWELSTDRQKWILFLSVMLYSCLGPKRDY